MATKNIVPRSSGEGTLGSSSKLWKEVHHVTASFGDISLLEDASNRLQLSGGPLVASSGLSGSLTQLSDGSSYLVEGSNVSIASGSNGQITISSPHVGVIEDLNTLGEASSDGEFIVATGAGAFSYESGATVRTSLGLGAGDSPTFTDLTLSGDLTVNGTTTTVNTDNLLVEDPVVLLGSGASAANTNGGLALLSGSSVSGESLVIGRVANDTWGVGRKDVTGGSVTTLADMTLVDFKAANITTSGNLLPDATLSRDIGSSAQEWRDIYLSDDSAIYFGADQDVSLVHSPDTGLILSMSNPSKLEPKFTLTGDGSRGPELVLQAESSGASSAGTIEFNQKDSGGTITDIAKIQTSLDNNDSTDKRSNISFYVESGNASDDALIITGSHNINQGSVNIVNHNGSNAGLQLAGTLVTSTATELNLLDGGISVGSSISLADTDGFIVNNAGTMKTIPASDIKTYTEGGTAAADDITIGDAAVTITTTSGNVTVKSSPSSNLILSGSTLASLDADTAVNIRGGGNTAIAIDSSGNITQLGPDTSPNTNEYLVWNGTSPVWETWRGFKYNRLTSGTSSTASLGNHYSFDFTQIAASYTLNLPAVSASNAGHEVRIIIKTHNAGSSLTIQPDTGDTLLDVDSGGSINNLSIDVNDASSVGTSLLLVSDGTDQWEIL